MKKGFSLIMAIFFLVMIATLGMMALSFSNKTAKQTVDLYLREQAELYAKSATDLTVLAMQRNNYTANCINTLTFNFDASFVANVNILYLDSAMGTCPAASRSADTTTYAIRNAAALGNRGDNIAIIDVAVSTAPGVSPEPIRYHRRTIQRP